MTDEEDKILGEQDIKEETVQFKAITDRVNFEIQNAENKQTLCVISGYDLDIDFNADALKSVTDIETCLEGLKDLFREYIMNSILKKQTPKE